MFVLVLAFASAQIALADLIEQPSTRWVADKWAPWECHSYVDTKQQESDWCAEVGFSDGYEFHYNGGVESECSPCWCCKRRAKQVPAETTSVRTTKQHTSTSTATTTATSTTTVPAWQNRLAWVVSDPKDAKFGHIVPESIIADPALFVFRGDEGVVNWDHKGRVVRKMKGSKIVALLNKAKNSRAGSSSRDDNTKAGKDCDEDGEDPCQTSLRSEATYLDAVLARYATARLPAVGGTAGHVLAAAVAAAFATLLVAGVALARRGLRHRQKHDDPLPTNDAGSCQALPRRDSGEEGSVGLASPLRRSRSASGQQMDDASRDPGLPRLPGLPRAGSSCQRLLALAENLA